MKTTIAEKPAAHTAAITTPTPESAAPPIQAAQVEGLSVQAPALTEPAKPQTYKPAIPDGPLTTAEAKEFTACRDKLTKGTTSTAEALETILEKKLFRNNYGSIEKFIKAECPFGKAWAYRLIQGSRILKQSIKLDAPWPSNIAQAIALAAAPEAKYTDVMLVASELAGKGKLTAAIITKAVKIVAPKPKKPAKVEKTEDIRPPMNLADALTWVRKLRQSIKSGAKIEATLGLLEIIEHALRTSALASAPADKAPLVILQHPNTAVAA